MPAALHQRRSAFLRDGVGNASPQHLLLLLLDRLVLDLTRGEAAQRAGDREGANTQLQHAQAILDQLSDSLDLDAWDGAAQLLALYGYLRGELVAANTSQDPARTATCQALLLPLRDAWREAALTLPASAPPARIGHGVA